MKSLRSLCAVLLIAVGLLAGCATRPADDGTVQNTIVGCETTSVAKSIACASATLKALTTVADKALQDHTLTIEQVQKLQVRFESVYKLIASAEEAVALKNGKEFDYLTLADDLLAAAAKELSK